MTTKKYSIVSIFCIATLVLILIYSFCFNSTKAYADEITEATVTTTDVANETNQTTPVVTTRKAPVSIAIYSNEVTESSDTYDFTKKQAASPIIDTGSAALPPANIDNSQSGAVTLPSIGGQPVVDDGQADFVVTTPAPVAPQATRDPQSTAAPDATPEPDIISYPPTVAPAYKD